MKNQKLEFKKGFIKLYLKLFIITISVSVCTSFSVFSQDTKEKKNIDAKVYSEEELNLEIEKRIKRFTSDRLIDLSKEIQDKEKELEIKIVEIQKKEEQLEFAKKEFEKKIEDFKKEQNKILSCMDGLDQKKKERVNHMVKVISNMKPDAASQLLSVQDAETSVEIIAKLDPAKLSKIFNLMDKEISARLQKQYQDMKR